MPVRLSPLDRPGPDAVLVGDPRRAFVLGQALTIQPEMSHLARGLWGYGGVTEGGLKLTVQATGVGGPSAVAVISDLAAMGVRRIIRLGTCTAVSNEGVGDSRGGFEAGSAHVIESAIGFDGASRTLAGSERRSGASTGEEPTVLEPDPELHALLGGIAPEHTVASHDLVLRLDPERPGSPRAPRAAAPLRDLQTAPTFAVAQALGLAAAAVLLVAEDADGVRIDEPGLEQRFESVGRKVVVALEQN